MAFNFDNPPSRHDSYSFKWQKYQGTDIIPAWVADTEFRCAPAILEALEKRLEHGNLGYTLPAQYTPAIAAVQRWLKEKHSWDIDADWVVWMPGVVPAFNVACKTICQQGDKVMVQTPNYPPLLAAPALHGLQRVDIPTVEVDGRWTLDFDELEKQAADTDCKLLILCNPMNPVGSVLTEDELSRVADICNRHEVTLCSDEIHCDLILEPGRTHLPAGKQPALQDSSITLMAASKTFNIAGLGAAFAVIPNPRLRRRFTQAAAGMVPWVNILGLIATEAAFTQCDDWHQAQLDYLRDNRDLVVNKINEIPGLSMLSPEATFLAWVDGSGLRVDSVLKWAESRGVGPSPGADFNASTFFRINFGCSRQMLTEILHRLAGQ